jgi:branched-chain amino acid transport system permease protein
MGLFIVILNILAICFGHETLRLQTQLYGESIQLGAISITYLDIITIFANLLLIVSLTFLLKYTFLGKSIRAAKDNIVLAEIIGVNVKLVYLAVFGIGSGIIALAASLRAMDIGINPTMGFHVILIAATAVIIGGLGSLPGAVLGAFLLGLAENIGVWKLSSVWQNTIAFGLLFVFIIFRPKGFFGEKMESAEI